MKKNWVQDYITEAFKETKEATGTGGGYGFSTPTFSMWSEDETAKKEYKRSKNTEVKEEKYCDSCDRIKSKCVCKKVESEFTEATDSSSVGPYDYNSFQDISMKGDTTKGKGRSWKQSQIPGGSFVEINPKCKTFPYCNQGNTGAVSYRKTKKESKVNEAIENVSKKTGLTTQEIKNIILSSIGSNL
jgi:hypothetical protein